MFWLKCSHNQGDKIQDLPLSIALPAPKPHDLNPPTSRRTLRWSTKLQKYKLVKTYKTAKMPRQEFIDYLNRCNKVSRSFTWRQAALSWRETVQPSLKQQTMRRAKRWHENLEWNLAPNTSSVLIRQRKHKTSWPKYRVVANVGFVVRSIVSEQDSCKKSGYAARCNRIRQRARDMSACHQLAADGIVLFQILPFFPSSIYGNRRHGLLVYLFFVSDLTILSVTQTT